MKYLSPATTFEDNVEHSKNLSHIPPSWAHSKYPSAPP